MAANTLPILLLVVCSRVWAQSDWNENEPFSAEDPPVKGVTFYLSNREKTQISILEGMKQVRIARMNYQGKTKPEIKAFDESKTNEDLGADAVQDVDNSWHLVINKSQDYEILSQQIYGFTYDTGSILHKVQLAIDDVDDERPSISMEGGSCTIEERTYGDGSKFCFFNIRDPDKEGTKDGFTYEITGSNSGDVFKMVTEKTIDKHNARAVLIVNQPGLDYERYSLHILTINITDAANNTGSSPIVVEVKDLPDMLPVWSQIFATKNIIEMEKAEIQVLAIDGDVMINAPISYRLEFPDLKSEYEEYFSIGEKSGLIEIQPINRDELQTEVFMFNVVAEETANKTSMISTTVIVIVADLNNHSPEITPSQSETTIDEGTAVQLELNLTISDPDLGQNGTFSMTLEDDSGNNWHEFFMVIPSTGYQSTPAIISILNAKALDFENPDMQTITLQVVAKEAMNSSHIGQGKVVIHLRDTNDETPEFSQTTYSASVLENAKKGHPIKTILAVDKDFEDKGKVKHTLTSGENMMTINETTGEITVAGNYVFDFEVQDQVLVQVMAEDNAKPVSHKAFAQLTVTVGDVPDTAPQLDMPDNPGHVSEFSKVGTKVDVGEIRATDKDTKADIVFDIDWEGSFALKRGVRVGANVYKGCVAVFTEYVHQDNTKEATASLTVNGTIDWNYFDTLTIAVVVVDRATLDEYPDTKRQVSALLTINVQDENNNAPEFTNSTLQSKWSVLERSPSGIRIGTIVAIDKDDPPHNNVIYLLQELESNLDTGLVTINNVSGELLVSEKSNAIVLKGRNDSLKYNILASDGNLTSVPLPIEIIIIDRNDNNPQPIPILGPVIIPENTGSGTFIAKINYTDDDVKDEYKTASFFLDTKENPRHSSLFRVDLVTGELSVQLKQAVLDRDPPDGVLSYDIKINLIDNYEQGNSDESRSNYTTVKVILKDVNDNAPVFQAIEGCLVSLPENTTKGVIYTDLQADDNDEAANGEVTYSCQGYNISNRPIKLPEHLFNVSTVGSKGQIEVLQPLTGLWGEYNLHVLAVDNPEDMLNQSRTDGVFKICVTDINDNDPYFIYPKENKTVAVWQDQDVDADLMDKNNRTVEIEASDDDDGDNALLTFTLIGSNDALKYFDLKLVTNDINKAKLILINKPDLSDKRIFSLKIRARDSSKPPEVQREGFLDFYVRFESDENLPPKFDETDTSLSFLENLPGDLQPAYLETEAKDDDNFGWEPTDPDWQHIYYYIIDAMSFDPSGNSSDGVGVFQLDKESRLLTLTDRVDREMTPNFTLVVQATNSEFPPNNPSVDSKDKSQITVQIKIEDENDSPPVFEKEIFSGGVAPGDKNGFAILTIVASDPDEDDSITYKIEGAIDVSDPSLDDVKGKPFVLNGDSGVLTLNFAPNDQMTGFFEFQVRANDSFSGGGDDHTALAIVRVFVISTANRVTFRFSNNIKTVDQKKDKIADIFTEVIGYNCTVDKIFGAVDDNGANIEDQTDVVTHFINLNLSEPVEKKTIIEIMRLTNVQDNLRRNLSDEYLYLIDYDADATPTDSIEGLLQIVLIVVSVVLGTLVIILFAAFFLKVRSLNHRLEALSTTKFGSQDSGLNRIGMAAPNTNKHAIEGSNPVWNEQINNIAYDAMSEDSYDSDLVGVEDRPEFQANAASSGDGWSPGGVVNNGYQSEAVPRRVSLNPLSFSNGEVSMEPDTPTLEEGFANPEHSNFSFGPSTTRTNPEHSNFSFGKPMTEL